MNDLPALDPTTLPPDRLAPMLRAWAAGLYPSEAAVELLIAHGSWLRRSDFLLALVDAVEDGWGPGGTVVPMASVAWDRVESFLEQTHASRSEASVLRLAASLAGSVTTASVLDLTSGLNDSNGSLVLQALAHRFGWHERGVTCRATGRFTERSGSVTAPAVEV